MAQQQSEKYLLLQLRELLLPRLIVHLLIFPKQRLRHGCPKYQQAEKKSLCTHNKNYR